MLKTKKLLLASSLLAVAGAANAGYEFKLTDNDTITFGGYIKGDVRYVDGDVISPVTDNNYWIGHAAQGEISQVEFSARETRFNTKYVHGDVTGFIEMDLYTNTGNEIISNSTNPRIRHAFVKYKGFTVGQTWTTFMNTSALAEAADFGGPLVAAAFIRQGQIRYTNGGFQVAIENPESDKGDSSQDSVPDVIAKYTFKGDWGNVSVAGLARQLNTAGGESESAFGYGVAGRIKVGAQDDFRFQYHGGDTGRYVGVVAARDLVGEEVEETTAISVAYRHFWSEGVRSTVFYGSTEADVADTKRIHWGVNLFKNYTPKLSFGLEFGNFKMDEIDKDSDYLQFSAKYVL
jgi:hypothetical protein